MKEILETIIKTLVDDQNQINISQSGTDPIIKFEIKVAQEDMGKVIGKDGKTADAIRKILRAVAAKQHKKILIEFVG